MEEQIDKKTMIKIWKYGTYYNPASKHYGNGGNIMCDKCYKDNLNMCIGYEDHDLCLNCVEDINKIKQKMIKERAARGGPRRMMQKQFR